MGVVRVGSSALIGWSGVAQTIDIMNIDELDEVAAAAVFLRVVGRVDQHLLAVDPVPSWLVIHKLLTYLFIYLLTYLDVTSWLVLLRVVDHTFTRPQCIVVEN